MRRVCCCGRYRSIAAAGDGAQQHGGQQQMRAKSRCQQAEHRLVSFDCFFAKIFFKMSHLLRIFLRSGLGHCVRGMPRNHAACVCINSAVRFTTAFVFTIFCSLCCEELHGAASRMGCFPFCRVHWSTYSYLGTYAFDSTYLMYKSPAREYDRWATRVGPIFAALTRLYVAIKCYPTSQTFSG